MLRLELALLLLTIVLSMLSVHNLKGAAASESDLLPKDLEIPLWDESFNFRTGVGYNDNVLLNDGDARASGFFVNGADITIYRLPLDDWEFHFLLSGDDIRYWHNVGVDHEDLWSATSDVKKSLGSTWQASLAFQYVYLDQVLDITDFALSFQQPPTNVIGHTFILRPGVQKWLASNIWVRLEMEGLRQFLTEPADSFWRFGPRVTIGLEYASRSSVALSYAIQDVEYDHLTDALADGTPVPGTSLRGLRQDAALAWKHTWDSQRHWQSTTKLTFIYFRDNFSGYYNYYEYGASEFISFSAAGWNITGSAGLLYDEFPVQTVPEDNSPRFRKTALTLSLKIERRIIKHINIFARYENETSLSDSQSEVYHANTISGGLDWEF